MEVSVEKAQTVAQIATSEAKRFVVVVEDGAGAGALHHFCNEEEMAALQKKAVPEDLFLEVLEITQGPSAEIVYKSNSGFRDHIFQLKERAKYFARCRDALNRQGFPKDRELRAKAYQAMNELVVWGAIQGVRER